MAEAHWCLCPLRLHQTLLTGRQASCFARTGTYVEVVRDYDVSADASRFIFVKNLTGEERPALIVVSHWLEEVRVKMERK